MHVPDDVFNFYCNLIWIYIFFIVLFFFICRDAVAAIEMASAERAIANTTAVNSAIPVVAHGMPSDLLFRGDIYAPSDMPPLLDNPAPCLGYRVITISATSVPFGLKGTIIAIHANSGFAEVKHTPEINTIIYLF